MLQVQRSDSSAAFGQLYDRHATVGFGLALRICGNRNDAEEVVQDAFLSIWRARATYVSADCFAAWANQVVRNRALDVLRRRNASSRPRLAEGDAGAMADAAAPSAHDVVAERFGTGRLIDVISGLPEAQSEAVALAYFGELTNREIARHLGVPLSTVKGRLRLAMGKLRPLLETSSS